MGNVVQLNDGHRATQADIDFWKLRCGEWRGYAERQSRRSAERADRWFLGGVCVGAILMWLGLR